MSIVKRLAVVLVLVAACGSAAAALDVRNASVERLENGLTVLLLEDRNLPVVSVQMLYRVGARDESYGHTGLAHFLEHMAFRSSEGFPDTGLVSSIYAVGGEWHGYTWTDQTTYFATVPKEHLDLLLRIEADRLGRLTLAEKDMEAERGAVLAEMHMYENYPSSMLLDALMFASFQVHPYRNNTIGIESDIEALQHREVVEFYRRHYRPPNAVLAIVGDFERTSVRARIDELFGDYPGGEATPLPRTKEPVQQGERRVRLQADTDLRRFRIGWRAPSARHPDFAAFLVLQEVLGKGSGVNFRQNDWGAPVDADSVLHGAAEDLTTWFPPSAQDYVFVVGGAAAADADEAAVEAEIERRVAALRERAVSGETLAQAIRDVLDELVFDVATTEDAAHQLAFFDGLHALDTLFELPDRVARVTAEDVRRVARAWLLPQRRTIAWHVPGSVSPAAAAEQAAGEPVRSKRPGEVDDTPMPPPVVRKLRGGITAIVQHSDISPTAFLQVVLPGTGLGGVAARADDPAPGWSSLSWRVRAEGLAALVSQARTAAGRAEAEGGAAEEPSLDPETRLAQELAAVVRQGGGRETGTVAPVLAVVSGDVGVEETFALLEEAFGDLRVPEVRKTAGGALEAADRRVRLGGQLAQAQLGYAVTAPGARDRQSWAWRIVQYVLSHDYEGRLGKEAISRRGLAYYIDSRYRSDGEQGAVVLAVGVDPGKLADLEALLRAEIARLESEPPTAAEIAEAKAHLVGRRQSAAQANEEIAGRLAADWLLYGRLWTADELREVLDEVQAEDVRRAASAFGRGIVVTVAE